VAIVDVMAGKLMRRDSINFGHRYAAEARNWCAFIWAL
jgi:hypothetical protein